MEVGFLRTVWSLGLHGRPKKDLEVLIDGGQVFGVSTHSSMVGMSPTHDQIFSELLYTQAYF